MLDLTLARDLTDAGDLETARVLLAEMRAGADPFDWSLAQAGWFNKQLRWSESLGALDEAVRIRPHDAIGWFNRAVCLYEMGRFDEQGDDLRRALKLRPDFAKAWMKLGSSHLVRHRFAEALACYERALKLVPGDPELSTGYATCLGVFGDDAGAERLFRAAWKATGRAESEVGLGFTLLRLGRWTEGWERFEARWKLRPFGTSWDYRGSSLWAGAPAELDGARVLLRSEQGFGDTLHFARYVPLVAARAAKVWLTTEPTLVLLLAATFPGVEVVDKAVPVEGFDIQTSLMTLPKVFGTTPEDVPPPVRYAASKARAKARVGLCWHGGARPQEPVSNADDQRRSIAWDVFAPLARVVPCVSLQQEDHPEWTDWSDTAGTVAGLDLVITVDTAVAHLAASLGVATWLMARKAGCWRWREKDGPTPWYPSMTVYMQPVLDEWAPVVERVAGDLRRWADANQ